MVLIILPISLNLILGSSQSTAEFYSNHNAEVNNHRTIFFRNNLYGQCKIRIKNREKYNRQKEIYFDLLRFCHNRYGSFKPGCK